MDVNPNGRDKVKTNSSYIIDDNVNDGALYINNQDPYWKADVEEKSGEWLAHINGLNDANPWLMKQNFPSVLSNFQYADNSGNWLYGSENTIGCSFCV